MHLQPSEVRSGATVFPVLKVFCVAHSLPRRIRGREGIIIAEHTDDLRGADSPNDGRQVLLSFRKPIAIGSVYGCYPVRWRSFSLCLRSLSGLIQGDVSQKERIRINEAALECSGKAWTQD